MKIFLIQSNLSPDFYCKAERKEQAISIFTKDLQNPSNYLKDPSFKVIEFTNFEQLMNQLPDEFLINYDTSF